MIFLVNISGLSKWGSRKQRSGTNCYFFVKDLCAKPQPLALLMDVNKRQRN